MGQLDEIREVGSVLEASGMTWWVNSGTLLGLYRDGRLLPWDSDVDLSVWHEDDGWNEALDGLRRAGWRIQVRSRRGEPYIAKMSHRESSLPEVHVERFRRSGEQAWRPVPHPWSPPFAEGSLRWRAARFLALPLRWVWHCTALVDRSVRLERTAERLGFRCASFAAPARFFDDLGAVAGLPAPRDVDGFLTWRYGKWRVPVRKWEFRRDDPAYVSPSQSLSNDGGKIGTHSNPVQT